MGNGNKQRENGSEWNWDDFPGLALACQENLISVNSSCGESPHSHVSKRGAERTKLVSAFKAIANKCGEMPPLREVQVYEAGTDGA